MGRNKYLTVDASGMVVKGRERRISQPTPSEMKVTEIARRAGAGRLIVGNDGAAVNTQWRLRTWYGQHGCRGIFGIGVRRNEVIVWMINVFDRRRINTAIEEIAYREENTITASVWSKKNLESDLDNTRRLVGEKVTDVDIRTREADREIMKWLKLDQEEEEKPCWWLYPAMDGQPEMRVRESREAIDAMIANGTPGREVD